MDALPTRDCPARWQGSLTVGDSWARWEGRAGDATAHRHFAAQAIFAPGGARVAWGDREVEGQLILIDPLVRHRLRPLDDVTLHFLEPAAVEDPSLKDALEVFTGKARVVVAAHDTTPFWSRWRRGDAFPLKPRDEAFVDVLRQIDAELEHGVVRLGAVARVGNLSASRFRHRFAAQVGLPFRRYVLWRRLRLAVVEMNRGADATTAAHAAGFADLAHFSRTLKAMFGVTASQALRLPKPS